MNVSRHKEDMCIVHARMRSACLRHLASSILKDLLTSRQLSWLQPRQGSFLWMRQHAMFDMSDSDTNNPAAPTPLAFPPPGRQPCRKLRSWQPNVPSPALLVYATLPPTP